jgi:putative ABC transport system substrate-binding protein
MSGGRTNRREFITALGGAAAWPLAARAQQSMTIPKVGVLWHAGNEQEEAPFLGALRRGLTSLGYIEGKNIELLNRFANEHYDRFDALAAELVEAKVDVIVASVSAAGNAAKRATSSIPVVVAYGAEYVVQELAHPGGNVTGLSTMLFTLAGKQLEILKGSIPSCSALALLWNGNTKFLQFKSHAQEAADALKISLHVVEIRSPDELEQAFSTIANTHANAVLIHPDGLLLQQRQRISQLAISAGLPTIGWIGLMTDAGVLMSYGADGPDLFRRAAEYIDKILKGANPADLPVEQPTKFQFVINLKTAQQIGLTIPPSVLARADEVIE